jgi:hypothetical protein
MTQQRPKQTPSDGSNGPPLTEGRALHNRERLTDHRSTDPLLYPAELRDRID